MRPVRALVGAALTAGLTLTAGPIGGAGPAAAGEAPRGFTVERRVPGTPQAIVASGRRDVWVALRLRDRLSVLAAREQRPIPLRVPYGLPDDAHFSSSAQDDVWLHATSDDVGRLFHYDGSGWSEFTARPPGATDVTAVGDLPGPAVLIGATVDGDDVLFRHEAGTFTDLGSPSDSGSGSQPTIKRIETTGDRVDVVESTSGYRSYVETAYALVDGTWSRLYQLASSAYPYASYRVLGWEPTTPTDHAISIQPGSSLPVEGLCRHWDGTARTDCPDFPNPAVITRLRDGSLVSGSSDGGRTQGSFQVRAATTSGDRRLRGDPGSATIAIDAEPRRAVVWAVTRRDRADGRSRHQLQRWIRR